MSAPDRQFPVIDHSRGAVVRSVPWAYVEQYRKQAERNHGQTLERLAERGGLGWYELECAANGIGLFTVPIGPHTEANCRIEALAAVARWAGK